MVLPTRGKPRALVAAGPGELGVTFIGHSSFLLQLAGLHILVDPVFARFLYLLKRRRHAGLRLNGLPPIDAVLLTHAHMDHLNLPTLKQVVRHTRRLTGRTPVAVVPRGVEDLLAPLGFARVIPLEWWQGCDLSPLAKAGATPVHVTLTPAQHWGARLFSDTHRGYGGYVVAGDGHRVYHSGDTAYFPGFTEIGRRLFPQIALLPIGAYFPDSFRGVHTSPEDALQGFLDLHAGTMIPMHYGTFRLSLEPMEEPLQRLWSAAGAAGVREKVVALVEGETRLFASRAGLGA